MAATKIFKIAPEVKQQILERVKQGEKPIAEIAQEHGVNPTTIYGWLSKGATAPPTWVEINKLKRENQTLMTLIGELTMKLTVAEKKDLADSVAMKDTMTKTALARKLGVSRASLYYERKLPEKDWALKQRIEEVLHRFPEYGRKRIAIDLKADKANKKRVLRVMKKFGIKPYRRRPRKPRKKRDGGKEAAPCQNLLLTLPFPDRPHLIWVKDFTYLLFRGRFVYLATVMDLFTRMVVGLVKSAFLSAVDSVGHAPAYCHSDQGSEYTAEEYVTLIEGLGITVSMSRKGCPGENGYQESFCSQFKLDLGDPNRFDTVGELIGGIAETMHRYTHVRIHTVLRMPPAAFAEQYELHRSKLSGDNVSKEMGA